MAAQGGPVSEMVLRKNTQQTVYGQRLFGSESYLQKREAVGLAPFDVELTSMPSVAATRLRQDVKLPLW